MPDVKKKTIDVPFSHGSIDLTDMNGGAHYEDRQGILFEFVLYDKNFARWASIYSKLANDIHGQKLRVILDNDRAYFYNMRLEIDSEKSKKPLSKIVLSGTAEPFKYELSSSIEPWLWDVFNFETGVITSSDPIEVDGTVSIVIPKGNVEIAPTFIVSGVTEGSELTVNDQLHTVNLKNGRVYDPRIRISGKREVTLTFNGKGSVQVEYRKGSL